MKKSRQTKQGMTRRDFIKTVAVLGAAASTPGILLSCSSSGTSTPTPDTIYYNAKIVTLDQAGTIASAVAVKDGNFIAVGSNEQIKGMAGSATRLVDLGGKTVVPGFVDGHTHPMETAMMVASWVDCRYATTKSVAQALQNIADWIKNKAVKPGDWVYAAASSASQNKYAEKRLPTKAELDEAAPNNPVVFANGTHMSVINSAAITVLGIKNGQTRLPNGGTVQLDADGNPTGTLTDAMGDIPLTLTPEMVLSYYTKEIQALWNQYGFTSVMAITPDSAVPVLQAVAKSGFKSSIRYTVSVWKGANAADMPADLSIFAMPANADSTRYRFSGIKVWVDGENDARTGYMYLPYVGSFSTDPPGNVGSLVTPQDGINTFVSIANQNNVIPMLHVSGDRAMDMGLDAYETLIKGGQKTKLLRLEHFGVFQMYDTQLQRVKKLIGNGLKINVQPTWMLNLLQSDFDNMGADRAATGFQFRSMIDAGLEPAAGSDVTGIYPENVNPFLGIYAAVTRASDSPSHSPFQPNQAITVTEALKMWTIWPAKAMGEEQVKGTIEAGKYADMAVLSADVLTIAPTALHDVLVEKTIMGGEVVYSAR